MRMEIRQQHRDGWKGSQEETLKGAQARMVMGLEVMRQ